jgi:exonuclease III
LTPASTPEYYCCDTNSLILNDSSLSKNELETLKGFRIAHLNITSLPKYIDQLRAYLINKPVDIFTINETRLDESISDEEVNIEGYNLYRKDRCRSGGGVAIYTRDVLNAREMSQFVPKDIEAVCLEIVKHKTKPILVTCIYRPPNSKADFMDALENYFHLLDEQDK